MPLEAYPYQRNENINPSCSTRSACRLMLSPFLAARLQTSQSDVQERLEEKLMNAQRTIFASVGIMLLAASASFAQQVKTDYDRSADFSKYTAYSWEKVQTQDPLLVDRIKQAVNAALAEKSLTPVESGGQVAIV